MEKSGSRSLESIANKNVKMRGTSPREEEEEEDWSSAYANRPSLAKFICDESGARLPLIMAIKRPIRGALTDPCCWTGRKHQSGKRRRRKFRVARYLKSGSSCEPFFFQPRHYENLELTGTGSCRFFAPRSVTPPSSHLHLLSLFIPFHRFWSIACHWKGIIVPFTFDGPFSVD